jgi:acetolactate synthase small subunit
LQETSEATVRAQSMMKTVILGAEFDQDLRQRVMDAMRELGASVTSGNRAVAGSQEIETLVVDLHGHAITVEAETYIGLSVTGEESKVDEILQRISDARRTG